jgi:hypothetical protein
LKKFKNIMKMALLCKNNNNSFNNPWFKMIEGIKDLELNQQLNKHLNNLKHKLRQMINGVSMM